MRSLAGSLLLAAVVLAVVVSIAITGSTELGHRWV
jgi:hypothetical protein